MSEHHRIKIQKSQVLNALIEHAVGKREMGATQVTAGIALLKKCLPDLSAVTLTGADGGAIKSDITLIELVAQPIPPELIDDGRDAPADDDIE